MVQTVKHLSIMRETRVRSLVDPLEKEMATHSSPLAWRIPWMEEPGGLQSDTTEQLHFDFSLSCIGEGNGNPLQYSCLENPKDREAWGAMVRGTAKSWTGFSDYTTTTKSLGKLRNTDLLK